MHHGQVFVLLIVGMAMVAGIIRQVIRAKYGYDPRTRRAGRRGGASDEELALTRKIELLSNENDRLTGQINRLEERLRVLERIATDPAERTSREIDSLR
ncbi:hypothetical protein KY084_01140 [Stakelama sp. CBK3Z-3]|uniref:DUF2746 domain-containing protein n=1 Tax=Stakelama flava TaxID=2860338 RepID=A0ABS6XGZ5_9SPHN|nr:hypothetical protein [Stakelama flava]MBW4329483.1 hypothetical protein [Stakelama flava]